MAQKFNVLVEQDEDGWFVGTVVELPGCHTQAKDVEELRRRLQEAIELYLEEKGTPVSAMRFVGVHQIEVEA